MFWGFNCISDARETKHNDELLAIQSVILVHFI